ncbi:MAG: hypothetical protein JSS15_09310 [Proteobacteria bacterium]|nr:hypothetical protein [Pseudomonadota bacterium]
MQVAADAIGDTAGAVAMLTGASILPPAPVRLEAAAQGDGGALVRWRRRGRSGWRWRDGADMPLGEEREQYRVTVTPAGLPARIAIVDTAAYSVSAAECAAGPMTVEVAQIGTNGASPAAAITF